MWADFSLWSTKCFEGKRFRALVNYKDEQLNIAQLEFISEVTDPSDELLPPSDWL